MIIRRKPEDYDVVDIFVRDDFTREVLKATGKFYQPFNDFVALLCFRYQAKEYNIPNNGSFNLENKYFKQFLDSQGITREQYNRLRTGAFVTLK